MAFSSCEKRTGFEIYRITVTDRYGTVLFEKEGRLSYSNYVKSFKGEAYADIYVQDQNYFTIYQASGSGVQVNKEYLGLTSEN
jgi:hypothetical protein